MFMGKVGGRAMPQPDVAMTGSQMPMVMRPPQTQPQPPMRPPVNVSPQPPMRPHQPQMPPPAVARPQTQGRPFAGRDHDDPRRALRAGAGER